MPQLKLKKSLGQNFLIDNNIREKIIHACNLLENETVLEIGPGDGRLTEAIAGRAKKVIAIEIDKNLCEILKKKFSESNIRVICADILKFDFREIKEKIKVVGCLPYYISTPIISQLLEQKEKLTAVYICLQKELAQRLVSKPGTKEYGAFSLFAQYHTQPRILFHIKKHCFKPVPKVDSSFLELKIRENPAVKVKDEKIFFDIIHAAFQQRRKTIVNALASLISKERLLPILEGHKIDKLRRPETLSLEDFAGISNELSSAVMLLTH